MSTIPKNAIPHAYAEPEEGQQNGSSFLFDNARRLAETARANIGTTAAIGAGVVAATAAATVALTRRGRSSGGSKGGKSKS